MENSSRAAADPAIEMENSLGTALVIEVDNSSVTDLAKKVGNSSGADLKQCDGQYLEEILLECSEVKVCNKRKSFLNASENIPKFHASQSFPRFTFTLLCLCVPIKLTFLIRWYT